MTKNTITPFGSQPTKSKYAESVFQPLGITKLYLKPTKMVNFIRLGTMGNNKLPICLKIFRKKNNY